MKPALHVVARHWGEISGTGRVLSLIVSALEKEGAPALHLHVPAGLAATAERRAFLTHGHDAGIDGRDLGSWWASLRRDPAWSSDDALWFFPNADLPEKPPRRFTSLLHDTIPLDEPSTRWKPWERRREKRTLRRHLAAEAIATVSEYSRRRLVYHLGPTAPPITVIGNAVRAPFYRAAGERPAGAVEERPLTVFYYGDLRRRKNVEALADGFLTLPAEVRNRSRFVFTGEGPRREKILSSVRRAGAENLVRSLGRIPDETLLEELRAADVLAFPSRSEGFGLPVAEAMAAGVPVLCGTGTSLDEVAAGAAWQTDVSNPRRLRDALAVLLTSGSLRDELARQGRLRADAFREEIFAEKWVRFFGATGPVPTTR